jgi:hypothetical protein
MVNVEAGRDRWQIYFGGGDLLAYEKDVNGADVELVKVRQGSEAVMGWMHAGVQLGSLACLCA